MWRFEKVPTFENQEIQSSLELPRRILLHISITSPKARFNVKAMLIMALREWLHVFNIAFTVNETECLQISTAHYFSLWINETVFGLLVGYCIELMPNRVRWPNNVHYFLMVHECPERSKKPGESCPSEDYAFFAFRLLHFVDRKRAWSHNAITSHWVSPLPWNGGMVTNSPLITFQNGLKLPVAIVDTVLAEKLVCFTSFTFWYTFNQIISTLSVLIIVQPRGVSASFWGLCWTTVTNMIAVLS